MSGSEKQVAAIARKCFTHKEIKVFVKNSMKDLMFEYCEREGIIQAQFIENYYQRLVAEIGNIEVKTLLCSIACYFTDFLIFTG